MRKAVFVLICVGLLSGFILSVPAARAANVTISLYGSFTGGWGFTAATESMPGPAIRVNQGDAVTINLFSSDGARHEFFIDYNHNGVPDTGEPTSSLFASSTVLTFTASVSGTFTYYCFIHPMMNGTWSTVSLTGSASADLTGRSAWPDDHHVVLSAGETEALFGRVLNTGTGAVNAKVVFAISLNGTLLATVNSTAGTIPQGGQMDLSGTYVPGTPGRYSVEAHVIYDSNGDGSFDGTGAVVKTFSFGVVS